MGTSFKFTKKSSYDHQHLSRCCHDWMPCSPAQPLPPLVQRKCASEVLRCTARGCELVFHGVQTACLLPSMVDLPATVHGRQPRHCADSKMCTLYSSSRDTLDFHVWSAVPLSSLTQACEYCLATAASGRSCRIAGLQVGPSAVFCTLMLTGIYEKVQQCSAGTCAKHMKLT
jgi:hypothetical protein